MKLTLLTGAEAVSRLDSEDFRSRWLALHERCPWATGCQHPDFVNPWYRLYHAAFSPVLVLGELADGSLGGLLTLALRRDAGRLTGAGAHQAEYQGWLAVPAMGADFIVNALCAVRARFPRADIHFKYLPPDIPLGWLDEDGAFARLCVVHTHRRPLMTADPAAMSRQRSKKNHRQNYNRLNRVGEIGFERVRDHAQFERIFSEICTQYDFRQAALYQNMPFSSDPFKRSFYLELHKKGLLHATVLTVGGAIAAAHIGVLSGKRAVHVGITTYDPAFAAHSPGNLLLAMLGVQLASEGIAMLDLTPGGDPYKEHFASGHDAVCELTIYADARRRRINEGRLDAIRWAKARLLKAGYQPRDLVAAWGKLRDVRWSGMRAAWRQSRAGGASRSCELLYRPAAPDTPALATGRLRMAKNRVADVLKFDSQGSFAGYCAFLGAVMKQMERSHHLYSFAAHERLLMFCWVRTGGAGEREAAGAAPARDTVVLSGLYVHPQLDNTELVRTFVQQMLVEVAKAAIDADIRYRGKLTAELQTVMKGCGFIDELRQP